MKALKKWIAYILIIAVLVIIAGVSYVTLALPNVGEPENLKVELTPQRIARGKYLATNVAACMDCHATRDMAKFAGPTDSTLTGAGGDKFDASIGFPGEVYMPNLTPVNLKKYTDGELFRAITSGVKKDGSALFPIMPYPYYAQMDREDIYDIIAYLRSLKPAGRNYPGHTLDFPLNLLVNTMPKKADMHSKRPAETDTLKYGGYLVTMGACRECHTKSEKGTPLPGMDFAGGNEFGLPGGKVTSANITPDKETGIGAWSKQQFVSRFRQYADGNMQPYAVKPGEFQTIMPWWKYGGMKVSDLEAIYTYLRSVKAVRNPVVKFRAGK